MGRLRANKRRSKSIKAAARAMIESVDCCLVTDPNDFEVRTAVVAPWLSAPGGANEWIVVTLGFEEDDRIPLYMDVRADCLVRSVRTVGSRDEAIREGRTWVGDGAQESAFRHLPGVFQAQFLTVALGAEVRAGPAEFMWAVPLEPGAYMVREFPPKLKSTEMTPMPGEVSFVLIPKHAMSEFWRQADW